MCNFDTLSMQTLTCWSHRRWLCQRRFAQAVEIRILWSDLGILVCHLLSGLWEHSLKYGAEALKTRFFEYFAFHRLYSLVRSSSRSKSCARRRSSFWTSPKKPLQETSQSSKVVFKAPEQERPFGPQMKSSWLTRGSEKLLKNRVPTWVLKALKT